MLGLNWDADPSTLSEHLRFIRSIDWASSKIGSPSKWPPQLQEAIDFMIADPTPAAIMWGEDLTMIYNEGFCEFAGEKHPRLMSGSPVIEYAEVWSMFIDIIERGKTTGMATRHNDVQLFLHRHGFLEECYVTYTFVPLLGPDKTVVGFYHTAVETTSQILLARRTQTLLSIGDAVIASRSLADYWNNLLAALEKNNDDVPWVIAYSFARKEGEGSGSLSINSDPSTDSATMWASSSCSLAGVTGKRTGQVPLSFDKKDDKDPFVKLIRKAVRYGHTVVMRRTEPDLPSWVFDTANGAAPSRVVLLMPIRPTSLNDAEGENVIGFLVVGLAPSLEYDEDYAQFARLCSRQLATTAASIMLMEQEIRRQDQLAEQLTIQARQAQAWETKLNRFADISNIGMWIATRQGELVYANKAWYDQADLSFNIANMNVEKWTPLVAETSLQHFEYNWGLLVKDCQPVTFECEFKLRWRYPDPSTGESLEGPRWFLITAIPEFDEAIMTHAWGCNIDISYQKWAQSLRDNRLTEILESKRQTENFIDMYVLFLYHSLSLSSMWEHLIWTGSIGTGTSHELRNPLSAILQCADGIASTMAEAKEGLKLNEDSYDATSDSAATIMACAQHQKRILDDILTMSKLDASLLVVTPCEVDPIATVQHALQLHQQDFNSANVDGYVRIDSTYHELHVEKVFLDPSRLLQVLINLITNAIKFTQFQKVRQVTLHLAASVESPAEGDGETEYFAPRVSAQKPRPGDTEWVAGQDLYLHFAIEDTGCGLNKEEMQRLFTRFSQASPKTHVQYGGSGLGLFICKELTELQGGRIGVSSIPEKGSTFRFYLKARRPSMIGIEKAADENAAKLENVVLEAHSGNKRNSKSSLAVKTLTDPDYINKLNREHSARSNPIIGSPTNTDALHVLIVEDNMVNQKVMAAQLRKAKCIVHVANHGADALVFLKKTTFAKDCGPQATPLSIVLMDLEMPVMDGLTCVKIIRQMQNSGNLTRPVPVIAVTANARLEQVQQAKDHGMDDVVTKPFRIGELMPQMYALIEKVSF